MVSLSVVRIATGMRCFSPAGTCASVCVCWDDGDFVNRTSILAADICQIFKAERTGKPGKFSAFFSPRPNTYTRSLTHSPTRFWLARGECQSTPRLGALSVNQLAAKLIVLFSRHPHLLKRAQGRQNRPSEPRAKLPLRQICARYDLELLGHHGKRLGQSVP